MSCWDHVGSKPNKKTPWIRAISKEYRHDLRTRRGRIPVASATYQMTDSEEKTFFVCSPYERNAFIGQINWDNSHDPFIENFREWTGEFDSYSDRSQDDKKPVYPFSHQTYDTNLLLSPYGVACCLSLLLLCEKPSENWSNLENAQAKRHFLYHIWELVRVKLEYRHSTNSRDWACKPCF